ncbi:2-C-methyl-D-erythritol 4-phosphate cytidylyltransferase [Gallionella capsiferriformans]|uniref:2-C-methyl-D-erythritol 4-phosphate cytidylyltransferase n=1 Tax=Gallionella capsiferriformans (strain ES-2) TaxID=395494 RepID=D9SCW1_GALCS|nr:2-C-methyl-D-erythritol 4-phosphate cytidylyltransferase [Gallionella capsiferriformans]ADL54650.1 2-C-methyl-D-erythritol 4-phosphate cytidylyltransferase [Gallionella capsiferriformans ES-2]
MTQFYALVPAAGFGARMGHELPKQYLPLAGHPMIYHAIATLCDCAEITTVFVVLSVHDTLFDACDWSRFGDKLQPLYCGGETRADTVLNGLLASELEPDDWVLVHDAARPCLANAHLTKLINELKDDPIGGILAVPVADTLKRANAAGRIQNTENREQLWQAQTPQMFRAGLLAQALQQCKAVTDEASAIEALGLHPKLVAGDSTNFKVTYPQDLRMAELLLGEKK